MICFAHALRAGWRAMVLAGLLASLIGTSAPVQAQTLPLAWATSAGGRGYDSGRSIAVDQAGNSYVTGTFAYSAVFGAGEAYETIVYKTSEGDNANRFGMFVAKYDRRGRLVWATGAAGGTKTEGMSLAVDGAGHSYVTGLFRGTVTFGPGEAHETTLSSTGTDMFLAKYDPEGYLVWVIRADNAGEGDLDIAVDGVGSSYVIGVNRQGSFIAKYDPEGQPLWSRQHGAVIGGVYDIAVDEAGNSYLTGKLINWVPTGNGGSDQVSSLSVAQYDSNGEMRWVIHAGSGVHSDTVGWHIAVDGVGHSYVIGNFSGTVIFGVGEAQETTLTGSGGFVAQYDSSGRLLWVRSLESTNAEEVSGIGVDSAGNLVVIGRFSGVMTFGAGETQETTLISDGSGDGTGRDIFVAKYDQGGHLHSAKQVGISGLVLIAGATVDSTGHSYVTGRFYGPTHLATFGEDDSYHITLKSHNTDGDLFVAKLDGGPAFVVLANSTVTLDRPGLSEGLILTNGALQFLPGSADAPSAFTGDLVARKDITMHPGNILTGTATAQGLVQVLPGATVTGEILANATVPKRPLPQPTFTADGPDQTVSRYGTLALEPGSYGQVTVDPHGTLQLRSGAYFLRSLTLGKAAQLVVDVSDGPVQLSVVESLVIDKQVQVLLTPDAADSALFTMTTLQIARLVMEDQAEVVGTLLAPYAQVRLDADSQFTGALIADKVTVQPDAMLRPHGAASSTP